MRQATTRTRIMAGLAAIGAAVLALVNMPFVGNAGTPGSDPGNGTWVGGIVAMPGPDQLVLWNLPGSGGALGTCVDATVNGPLRGPYTKTATINDAVYAELNHLYAKASTSDVRLAELSALNSRKYDVVDKSVQWSYLVNGSGGTSTTDADAMLAEATRLSGPYRVSVALPTGAAELGQTYHATVSVVSAAGVPVPGAAVTLAATGAALAHTSLTTDSAGKVSVAFTIPSANPHSYAVYASVPAWTQLAVYTSPGEQRMISTSSAVPQKGSATAPIAENRDVELVKVALGDSTKTPAAGYTYRITDAVGHVVATVTTSASGGVSVGRLAFGATYTATEIAIPANAALYIPVIATTTFTVPVGGGSWVLQAADPRRPTPTVTTRANAAEALVGAVLSDTVTVSGNDGENGTVVATRYGPVAPIGGGCDAIPEAAYLAAAHVQVSAAVAGALRDGNGDVVVTGPAVTAAGCYGWAEQLTLVPSQVQVRSAPTAPHESTLVTAPATPQAAPPTVLTTPPQSKPRTAPQTPRTGPHAAPPITPLANTGVPVMRQSEVAAAMLVGGAALGLLGRSRRGRHRYRG